MEYETLEITSLDRRRSFTMLLKMMSEEHNLSDDNPKKGFQIIAGVIGVEYIVDPIDYRPYLHITRNIVEKETTKFWLDDRDVDTEEKTFTYFNGEIELAANAYLMSDDGKTFQTFKVIDANKPDNKQVTKNEKGYSGDYRSEILNLTAFRETTGFPLTSLHFTAHAINNDNENVGPYEINNEHDLDHFIIANIDRFSSLQIIDSIHRTVLYVIDGKVHALNDKNTKEKLSVDDKFQTVPVGYIWSYGQKRFVKTLWQKHSVKTL